MAPRAQTLKQAKAAYKSRTHNPLSEREKKQLERSVELERRAWRAKEAEKRKAEAKAKREEQQRKEREGAAGMTSQRRCDRFGFVGSQMHLGAFFGGGGGGATRLAEQRRGGAVTCGRSGDEEDTFDSDLDDESMLEALRTDEMRGSGPIREALPPIQSKTEDGRAEAQVPVIKPSVGDLDLFWDELDSSTQIARDLGDDRGTLSGLNPTSHHNSFSSGEFDICVEDVEEVQAADPPEARIEADRKLMPPPALPISASRPVSVLGKPLPPSLPSMSTPYAPPQPKHHTPDTTAKKPPFAPYLDFTIAELESFIDDDLQLTQVDPV